MDNQTLPLLVAIVVIAVGGILIWFNANKWHKQKLKQFNKRLPLTTDDFYTQYYAHSGIDKATVLALLEDIAFAVDIPPTLIRPDDRFNVEFAPQKGWEYDDGLMEFTGRWHKQLHKKGLSIDLSQLKTVDDFIRAVGPHYNFNNKA